MNIVSVTVGASLVGLMAPGVAQMSLQPVMAQKRATNFGVAESAAVTFASSYEGGVFAPVDTEVCTVENLGNLAYNVTCVEGEGRFKQQVTRAFRLKPEDDGSTYTNPNRNFAFDTPSKYSHVECLPGDPWGVIWYNDHLKAGNMDACIPAPVWSKERYRESNPDDWLYDLSGYGFGRHPDY